jgi:putative Holliday junction resolvase
MDAVALCHALPPNRRVLGIDPGAKRIGLALSDVRRRIASPAGVVKRGRMSLIAIDIARLALAEDVGGMIVGLPLEMDGGFGPRAQAARDWARDLSDMIGLPAAMWDERLSSAAVNRAMIREADLSRGKRARAVDPSAAAWILQAALDAAYFHEAEA